MLFGAGQFIEALPVLLAPGIVLMNVSMVVSQVLMWGVVGWLIVYRIHSALVFTQLGARLPIDLYRLTDPHAWRSAGLREAFSEGLVVVEWPEHGHGLPSPDLAMRIDWADPDAPEGPRLLTAKTDQPEVLACLEALASEAQAS